MSPRAAEREDFTSGDTWAFKGFLDGIGLV